MGIKWWIKWHNESVKQISLFININFNFKLNVLYNLTALIDSLTYLIKILMPLFVLSAHKTYQLSCNARISSWVKSKALLFDILVCNIHIYKYILAEVKV